MSPEFSHGALSFARHARHAPHRRSLARRSGVGIEGNETGTGSGARDTGRTARIGSGMERPDPDGDMAT